MKLNARIFSSFAVMPLIVSPLAVVGLFGNMFPQASLGPAADKPKMRLPV